MLDQMGPYFLANGEKKPAGEFQNYGTRIEHTPSVYEVIRVEEGVPLFLEDYLERMQRSFSQLNLTIPFDEKELVKELHRLIRINDHQSGPVKLVFGHGESPFFLMYLMRPHLPSPEAYKTGVKTVTMKEVRVNPNVKSWNQGLRERSVKKLQETGAYEAILVDGEGNITEASRSNVFFLHEKTVFTAPMDQVLPGITRKKVLEVCAEIGIPVVYEHLPLSGIERFRGCFLTGTARRVVPVKWIDEIRFVPDTELFRKISNAFEEYVRTHIREHR
jgi:branched-chain amino acid aminotransferase